MKKILIGFLMIVVNFCNYTSAEYDMKSCQYEHWNNCPTYSIGKVLSDTSSKIMTELDILGSGETESLLTENHILIPVGNNQVFLMSGGIDSYNESVLNYTTLGIHREYYLPKKGDIIIYTGPGNFYKNEIKDIFFTDLDSDVSYIKDGKTYIGKDKFDYIMNGYTGNIKFNDSGFSYAKLYCENNIIYIDQEKNVNFGLVFPSYPAVNKEYNMSNFESDLQVLAPCSNFNELFGLEEDSSLITEKQLKYSIKEKINTNSNIFNKYYFIGILLFVLILSLFIIKLIGRIRRITK